ncbi:MAG: hypothetical protein ING29_12530, partial [Azospirillum sp.]|nr:hypothetical protein [Azospirillum sp.]
EQATSALMESCRKQEHFDPSALRGRGARLETLRDGSTRFVFNTGRFLIIDGARVEYENYKGDYFYTASSRAIEIADEQLDAEARMKFSAFIARFRWEKPHYADFVIGWLLMAAVAGALEWRCMLWITGAAGSGKSFLLDRVIALLFGRALVAVNSSTTDKGLASLLGNDSVPFTFDEAESSDEASNARNRATLRALRAAAAGSQAVRAVGSSSGKARTTQINGAGAFASIADAVTDQADEQRFLTPKLLPPNLDMEAAAEIARQQEENRAYVDETLTPEFAARFLSFAVRNFSGIRQSIDVFAEALTEDLGNRRFGLHFGTAFGCRYFFEYGEAPFDVAQARDWFVRRGIAMSDLVDLSATRSPAEIAASDLLSARVEVTDAGRYSIADLIRAVVIAGSAGDRLSQKLADRTLRYHGIIVDFDGKRIRLAGKHMQLNKIFERSSSGKNAFDALKTLTEPDDRIFQKTVHFAPSGSHHCIAFKLVKILDTQRDLAAPEAGAAAAGHPEAIGMSGRIMSLDVWVTNLDDRNVRETIDSLRRIARDLNLATVRGISQIEARLVLARYGIVPHMDDRVLIARRHPKLMEMLGRGGNAVGRDYAQVLQPLIRGEYGTQELGGVHCEMIELDLAANRDAPF